MVGSRRLLRQVSQNCMRHLSQFVKIYFDRVCEACGQRSCRSRGLRGVKVRVAGALAPPLKDLKAVQLARAR